jgi:hypothetical protein
MTKVYTRDLSATTRASERDNVEDTGHETGIQDKNLYPTVNSSAAGAVSDLQI